MNGVELVASWLTPTVLFCVMNVMIGTIFFRSSLKPPRTKQQNKDEAAAAAAPRFERVSSFLQRVKSFNLSRYEADHRPDPVHQGFPDPEPAARELEEVYHEIEESHHVTRYNSGEAARGREEACHEIEDTRHVASTSSAAVAEAARHEIVDTRHVARASSAAVTEAAREREDARHEIEDTRHVARTSSAAVAEAAREKEEVYHEIEEPHHVARTKSGAVAKSAPPAKALQRSASEKMLTVKEKEEEDEEYQRRPATARRRAEGAEVDGKADDFIIKFRKQLKLQRMDSIVRYNEMIDRGAGRWR